MSKKYLKVVKDAAPQDMSTIKEIDAEIKVLKAKIEQYKSGGEANKISKIAEEVNAYEDKITFLNRLRVYAIERAKIQGKQVLVPTTQKGLKGLYKEMSSLLKEVKDDKQFASVIPDLERNVKYLKNLFMVNRKSKGKKQKQRVATRGYTRKAGIDHEWFTWDGMKLYKPLNGLELIDSKLNIIADKDVGNINLDSAAVKSNADNGDYLLVLRRVNTKKYKYAALTITIKDILHAREQRLQLAYLGSETVVASLIVRDLEGVIDKRLKEPAKIIEKHKEDFLSAASHSIIMRDIDRMLKVQ